jgi:hypothetical protein
VIFFCNKIVETGAYLKKRGIERSLGAIMRMEVEVATGRKCIKRSGSVG